jgi:putative flippase GtrA
MPLHLQALTFFINGAVIGVLALGLQNGLFRVLGGEGETAAALASALTYLPLVVLNFLIQRSLIFQRQGMFTRFVASNLVIMVCVSGTTPLLASAYGSLLEASLANSAGFASASLLFAIPSFLLKRTWVFGYPLPTWRRRAVAVTS